MSAPAVPLAFSDPLTDPDCEALIAGALLNSPSETLARTGFLDPDHFASPFLRLIHAAAVGISKGGQLPTMAAVFHRLQDDDLHLSMSREQIAKHLDGLAAAYSTTMPDDAERAAVRVADLAIRRDLAKRLQDAAQELRGNPDRSPADILAEISATKPCAGKLDLVWADDIQPDIDGDALIDGLLGSTGLTVAYGESGCGKTFVALDIACHVAAGLPWRDLDVAQGIVVYVAAESPKSVERRVWAWKRHHSLERLPLVVVRSSVNLLDGDTGTIIAQLAEIQAKHGHIALVVIDTLARAMVGNENSPEDMGGFVAACGKIREASETHVLVVHHTGKELAKGARGHSCLRAATDVELEITDGSIRVSKARDEIGGAAYGFRLVQVEIGTSAKGRRITTCLAIEADPPPGGGKRQPTGANARLVLDALKAAIADQPEPAPPAPGIPSHVRGCSLERWQETAMLHMPQAEGYRKREAFNRATATLVAAGHAHHVAGFAWLP